MNFIILLVSIVVIIVVYFCVTKFYNYLCVEKYISDYYNIDWNDPKNIKNINSNIKQPCEICNYSLSCDLSDDAVINCYKSHDIPILNKNIYHMSSI